MIDRHAISRAIAKALAYHDCGRNDLAEHWAVNAMWLLHQSDVVGHDRIMAALAAIGPEEFKDR